MSESYDKINNTRSHLGQIVGDIFRNRNTEIEVFKNIYSEIKKVNKLKICLEIDDFIKEYPDTYPKYLQTLLDNYISLQTYKNKCVAVFIPVYDERDLNNYPGEIFNLFSAIDFIKEHLKGILEPETEIQDAPKQIKIPPNNQTIFSRDQTVLLFWYLRKNKMISQSVQNDDFSIIIEQLTGYSSTTLQDVLKTNDTDVWQLGKGKEKVLRKDFVKIVEELHKLIDKINSDCINKAK